MKKALPHLLYIVVIVFFVIFAQVKAGEAVKAMILNEENNTLAQKAMEKAMKQEQIATKYAAEARMQEIRATEIIKELEACKAGKK